jgi:hypothetical protein
MFAFFSSQRSPSKEIGPVTDVYQSIIADSLQVCVASSRRIPRAALVGKVNTL